MSQAIEIAKIIKSQISTRELMAIGAKDFVAIGQRQGCEGGLMFNASLFKAKRCKVVVILTPADLYDVLVLTGRLHDKVFCEYKGIFAEDLEFTVISEVEKRFAA